MSTNRIYRQLDAAVDVETITASKSLDVNDSSKTFLVGTDALVITLPSTVLGLRYKFVNTGADGAAIITISPAAADGITYAGTATDNKDLILTKATAKRGDRVTIASLDGTVAWQVMEVKGIWAKEA